MLQFKHTHIYIYIVVVYILPSFVSPHFCQGKMLLLSRVPAMEMVALVGQEKTPHKREAKVVAKAKGANRTATLEIPGKERI